MKAASLASLVIAVAALGFGAGYLTGPGRPAEREFPPPRPAGEAANAVTAVLVKPASIERTAELATLLTRLGPDAVDEVVEAYKNAGADVGEVPHALLVTWWIRYAPEDAFAWINSQRRFSTIMNTMAIREWARNDPATAAQGVKEITAPDTRILAARSLAVGWAENGAPGFHEYAAANLSRPEQQTTLDHLMTHLVETRGSDAAIAFAEAAPDVDERYRTFVLQRTAKAVAAEDGPTGAAFAERHGAKPEGWAVYQFAAAAWAKTDGAAALAWASSLPPGKQRDSAVELAFRTWALSDRPAAVAWFPTGPVEAWLEPALFDYSTMLYQDDRAAGIAALGRISNEQRRRARTRHLLDDWKEMAPRSYEAYVSASDLPAHVRAALDAAASSEPPERDAQNDSPLRRALEPRAPGPGSP